MSARRPTVERFGDQAFLVVLGGGIGPAANARAQALAAAIRAEAVEEVPWGRPVPAYESVLVPFDPDALGADAAEARLRALIASTVDRARAETGASTASAAQPVFEIPTRYGGADGPDLAEVAERLGSTPADVVALHARHVYTVSMLGFSPGFAYLGILPRALQVPRRDSPRTEVPAGSVAIAARQTGVYPIASPGGWNLIGRTDTVLWDPHADPPTPLTPGRRVLFVPVAG